MAASSGNGSVLCGLHGFVSVRARRWRDQFSVVRPATFRRARRAPRISSAEFLSLLREDYATNRRSRLKWTFFTPGFQAIAVYRLGVWCNGLRPWILRAPIRLVAGFLSFFVRNFYGIELYPTAQIGRRFGIVHQHGIVIHKLAVIGDDCLIRQGVTIGAGGRCATAPGRPGSGTG